MRHYDSIPRVQDDRKLIGEDVWAFNKLDGQNFCARYNPRTKDFPMFGSRKVLVDETSEQFGDTVRYFKEHKYDEILNSIVRNNNGKKGIFKGIEEITFFFEWYGENSFAGRHQEGDEMHLALIDVHLKKKGYIEPGNFYELFCKDERIETPDLIFHGKLTQSFITSIWANDVNGFSPQYPSVKEGVVCTISHLQKGQRLPKVKFKTKWWIDKLHSMYSEEECKLLE